MPFIDSKVTVKMSDDQKETLKSSLGQAITTMNKTESYLMVGIKRWIRPVHGRKET